MRRRRPLLALLAVSGVLLAACGSGDSALRAGEDGATTLPLATDEVSTGSDTTAEDAPSPDSVATDDGGTGTESSEPDGTDPAATEPPGPTTTAAALAQYPDCPVGALDAVGQPVEITFWHGMANEAEAALGALTDEYNESQDRVRVELQNQVSYESTIDKYVQVGSRTRPDLVQLPEFSLQSFAQSDTFVPVQACIEAAEFDTSPYLQRGIDAYVFEGIQWAMPFNISSPILYYNRQMFEAAGLDPDRSPITLEELRAASEVLVESEAAGFGLVLDSGRDSGGSWYLEQWFGRVGAPYSDNGNGRLAPSTQVLFDSEVGVELMTFLQELIADGLAVNVGDNPGGQDAVLKMIDPEAPGAMTVGTSAALGSVVAALGSGIAEGITMDDIGVGPMPGPSETPSAQVGGAALWIPADKGELEAAAAWDFITYLTTAESQSRWAAATGFVPVREDAAEVEPLATTYADDPRFAVAYAQLLPGADDVTANAPVLGPQRVVRAESARATAAIFDGADVAAELATAAERSDGHIASYNARVD